MDSRTANQQAVETGTERRKDMKKNIKYYAWFGAGGFVLSLLIGWVIYMIVSNTSGAPSAPEVSPSSPAAKTAWGVSGLLPHWNGSWVAVAIAVGIAAALLLAFWGKWGVLIPALAGLALACLILPIAQNLSGILSAGSTARSNLPAAATATCPGPADPRSIRLSAAETTINPGFRCQVTFEVVGGVATLGEPGHELDVSPGSDVGNILKTRGIRVISAKAKSGSPILNYMLCPQGTARGWTCNG